MNEFDSTNRWAATFRQCAVNLLATQTGNIVPNYSGNIPFSVCTRYKYSEYSPQYSPMITFEGNVRSALYGHPVSEGNGRGAESGTPSRGSVPRGAGSISRSIGKVRWKSAAVIELEPSRARAGRGRFPRPFRRVFT